MVDITVKLFAAYQEAYGQPELKLEVPPGTTVAMVGDRLREPFPHLHALAAVTRYGINLDFVAPETVLRSGDEVVLIPPVSGG
ncbi:MAG TPA: MoaD/ThiS family protein [Stenomitos sp.]